MFEQLISFKNSSNKLGVVESIKASLYLAYQVDNDGNIIKRAPHGFKSLALAKQWLRKQGIHTISLRQSPAYFEMIGLGA